MNLKQAASQLQLSNAGMSRYKLRLSASFTELGGYHAQTTENMEGDGIKSKDTHSTKC